MSFKKALLLTATLFLSIVAGKPLENRDLAVSLPIQPEARDLEYVETGLLEKRDNCETLNTVISTIGTSKEIAVYASWGGFSAYYVCRRMHGWNCEEMASAIAAGIASLFLIANRVAAARSAPGKFQQSMAAFLEGAFNEEGLSYTAIEDVTPHLQAKYASDQRQPVEVTSIKGLVHDNATFDFNVFDFGDGEGHLYFPSPLDANTGASYSNSSSSATSLEKRAKAPGFKISYTTRMQSKLSRPHQTQMARQLATRWAHDANSRGLKDYIGLVKTGHKANFYWRIIPETNGYGLNYESVDVCGGMARFL